MSETLAKSQARGAAREGSGCERMGVNSRASPHHTHTQVAGETLARAVREAEDLPSVMDYLGLKAQQAEVDAELTAWRRKVEIVELAARQAAARARLTTSAGGGRLLGGPAYSSGGGGGRGATTIAAFGSSAPGRAGPPPHGKAMVRAAAAPGGPTPFAASAAVGGRVATRGIGGFGGALFSARTGAQKAGSLFLGLPPAVRNGR